MLCLALTLPLKTVKWPSENVQRLIRPGCVTSLSSKETSSESLLVDSVPTRSPTDVFKHKELALQFGCKDFWNGGDKMVPTDSR